MSTELRRYCDWTTSDGPCDADGEILTVVIDGKTYKVDTCEQHREGLVDMIASMSSKPESSSNGQVHTQAEARKWLRRNGYPVHTKGKVPEVLLREFRAQVGPVA